MSQRSILVIEDDSDIFDLIRPSIEELGYIPELARTGTEGLALATAAQYALVILDLSLPGVGGLEILREIRKRFPSAQVLILSAHGSELDRVLGLELGADDYVVKPFSAAELRARIRTRLRSNSVPAVASVAGSSEPDERLIFGELEINLTRRTILSRGELVDLTALEFDLVAYLALKPGVPVSRDNILEDVWGVQLASYESNVNSAINRLRRKLEPDPREPRYLLTVWGVGYKWVDRDGASR